MILMAQSLAIRARAAGSEVFSYGLEQGEFRAEDVQMLPPEWLHAGHANGKLPLERA